MSAIHEKLVAVTRQIALEGIGKTRKNAQQGYNFRGVDEVMNAFAPILAAHGLFIRPRFMGREVIERQSSKGGTLFYITVKGEFDFVCDNGESVTVGPFYGEAMDSADKATNKAMATAFKYAMFQTFCVPLEGVTGGDADSVTHEVSASEEGGSINVRWFEAAVEKYGEDFKLIGECIDAGDWEKAVEIYYAIPEAAIDAVFKAPTKVKAVGLTPVFTTQHRTATKSNEWSAARNRLFQSKNKD